MTAKRFPVLSFRAQREIRNFSFSDRQIIELKFESENGKKEKIDATIEHPFRVKDRGWISTRELLPGDEVFTSKGGWLKVTGSTWLSGRQTVYNFEVDGLHNYFVGELGAWVHNASYVVVPKTAESAADAALAAGKKRGAAAQLDVNGKIFTDVSGGKTNLHPTLQEALDNVPEAERAPWHGQCAEIGNIDQALKSGVDPSGWISKAVNIGKSGTGHGAPKPACSTCRNVQDQFGIKY